MVIKCEMYPGGGYKKMGFSHHEEEKMYTESYGGSSMQMMRPNPCISTPEPPHSHRFAGAENYNHGQKQHGHSGYYNNNNAHGQHGHNGYYNNNNAHGQHGHNGYGNGRVPQETMMFSHETHYATSHAAMSPNMHAHHFDLKNLDD